MSDQPGVFLGIALGIAKIIVENPGEAPKVIECPIYQLTDENGQPLAPEGAPFPSEG